MSCNVTNEYGMATCQTALGWMGIAWSPRGLAAVSLPRPTEAEALSELQARSDPLPMDPPQAATDALADKLRRYFEGEEVTFDEPLDPTIGTDFQRRIWATTRAIPRGRVRTYGEIAREAGVPKAARAVGQAMARNPWPVIVPCHRVVGHNGRLTGFGGGVDMKRQMLEMEGALRSIRI